MKKFVALVVLGYIGLLSFGVHECVISAPPPAPYYLAPLQKDTEITIKETPSGYRITLQSPGTHKVTHLENDFIIITDATGVTTTRIGKHAILSISEIKIPR